MEYLLRNGKKVIIRKPNVNDAEAVIDVMTKADAETLFWQEIQESFVRLLNEKDK